MRKYILLLLLLQFVVMSAETADSVMLHIVYNTTYATYGNGHKTHDVMALDVGHTMSHFYSEAQRLRDEQMKKINESSLPPDIAISSAKNVGGGGLQWHVCKRPSGGDSITFYDTFGLEGVKYTEVDNRQQWHIEDGDTTICGYSCGKAWTDIGGRRWTAWFTADIPVSDGPWKLRGLPGLILKAVESDGIYSFCCTSITSGNGMLVEMPSGNYTDCTYDEYKTLYYKYNDDPIQFLVTRTGNSLPIPGSKRKSAIISIDEKPFTH